MKSKQYLLWILLVLAAGFAFSQQRSAVAQSNLVNNPSFEEPYNSGVAQGWARWHEDSNEKRDCSTERYVVQPVWSPEFNPDLILDGARSMHVGNQFDTWRGGVFQDIPVTAGSTYRFSVWAWGRGTNEQYPAASDTSVNMRVRVGIDPNGGGLWTSGSIVWSGTISPHNSWQQVAVEAPANGDKITIFIEGDFSGPNQCRAHLDLWFDKAEVVAAGPAPTNTPPPQPTAAPVVVQPTAIPPTATPIPTETPIPSPTPIPTDTPVPPTATPAGGSICINAFGDLNSNGVNDPDEGYMAGIRFTVAQNNAIVGEGVSPGTNTPVCFNELPPGSYQVAQTVPDSLQMTTAGNITVNVQQGEPIGIEFGSKIKEQAGQAVANADQGASNADQATGAQQGSAEVAVGGGAAVPVADQTQAPADSGFGLWEIAAIGIMLFALLLLAAIVVILLRQQRSN